MARLLILLVAAAILGAAWFNGRSYERGLWENKMADAVQAALGREREQQRGINDALQKQADSVAAINITLAADLDELRKRPGRVRTVISPPINCPSASGAELAREYAEFLVRYAAKAAEQDAALTACYEYADAIQIISP